MHYLSQKRSDLIAQARSILDVAKEADRALSSDEASRYDALNAEIDRLGADIERDRSLAALEHVPRDERGLNNGVAAMANGRGRWRRDSESAALKPEERLSEVFGGEGRDGSLGRQIQALVTGNRRRMSDYEARALSEGTDASGGYAVPEDIGAKLIDRVRSRMAVMKAGALTIPMTSDTLNIARLASGASPSWKAENASISESALTFERVQLTARTLPILVKASVELFEDAVGLEQALENELAQAIALELDRVALRGSGSAPEPRGIRNQSGVTVTELGSGNGATPSFDNVVDAIGTIWQENGEPTAIIQAARTSTNFAKLKDSEGRYLAMPPSMAQIPTYSSNQVPTNLTVGTSNDCSEIYVADFRELLVGMRSGFRLEVSRVSGDAFEKMQVWLRAYIRADVALAHPKLFSVNTGVRP